MSIKPNLWTIPQPTAQVLAGLPDKISVLVARLRQIADTHHAVRFASSLAVEDMLITDLIARTIVAPMELPVGAVTALIGAPFFAYVYFKKGS